MWNSSTLGDSVISNFIWLCGRQLRGHGETAHVCWIIQAAVYTECCSSNLRDSCMSAVVLLTLWFCLLKPCESVDARKIFVANNLNFFLFLKSLYLLLHFHLVILVQVFPLWFSRGYQNSCISIQMNIEISILRPLYTNSYFLISLWKISFKYIKL